MTKRVDYDGNEMRPGQWRRFENRLVRINNFHSHGDFVYFANDECVMGAPLHQVQRSQLVDQHGQSKTTRKRG